MLVARPSRFKLLAPSQLRDFTVVCAMIAIGLACSNIALSLLDVAVQQCIRAAS